MMRETCTWSHGRAEMQSLGAMLAPVDFTLPDYRIVSPLHIAPWANEKLPSDTAPILQSLRGEWPCVPFGAADLTTLDIAWQSCPGKAEVLPHGYASNAHWQLQSPDDISIEARIDYPAESAISALERRVKGVSGSARLELELLIYTRADICIPIGVHPIFRLPENPRCVQLNPGKLDYVWIHPGNPGGPSLFSAGKRYHDLSALPGVSGDCIDASRLPFIGNSENLLLLSGTQGRFEVLYLADNYKVVLEWNAVDFPCVMLWISNRGRQEAPWLGRHMALGIEPVCAAFDLGTDISASDNPLSREGIKTAIPLAANSIWQTSYSISAEPI